MMGRPQKRRVDRSKKRGWNGNQHTGPVKKKVVENKSPVDTDASTLTIDTSDKRVSTPSQSSSSVSPDRKPVDFNSASGQKLKNNARGDIVFDRDEVLTGFRFVDIELLIDFVQPLLCPTCKRPLGQSSRQSHSHVTEYSTNQASKQNLYLPASARKMLFCLPQQGLLRV